MSGDGDNSKSDPIFKSIALSAPSSMMLLDRDAKIRFINRTAPGLEINDVIGSTPYDYVPADQHEDMKKCFDCVTRNREVCTYESVFRLPDSSVTFWESRVSPVERDGELTGFVVFSADVTERRMLASELDRFFEFSPDMVVVCETDGTVVRMSPSAERILGYSEADGLRAPLLPIVHPEDRERTQIAFDTLVQGSPIASFENRNRHKDGHYVIIEWRAGMDPQQERVYAIGRDVTQQRAMEDKLRQSQKIEAVGQLAGGVAHDFNNLLQAIILNTQAATATSRDRPKIATFLDEIRAASQRASDLTRQLLTFSRRASITRRSLSLNDVVRDLLRMLRRLLPESIDIEFIPGHSLGKISGDQTQLEQVLVNVCVNARDAMPEGGRLLLETANVVVDEAYRDAHPWAEPGSYVLITVIDTGEGMTPEVKERIFEPFYTTKEPGKGTGLGLSTLYGIVQQHDGFVHVHSMPGSGTSFRIYLPASERPVSGGRADLGPAHGPPHGDESPREERKMILVAEDEVLVRSAIVRTLEQANYDVVAVADGYEALVCLRDEPGSFDLVLLDMVMPGLSGPDTYERMQEIESTVPVVFCSGYSDTSRFSGKLPPGTVILRKPFKTAELLARIMAALRKTA